MPYNTLPTADGTDTLFHDGFRQAYHSRHGALEEARHVFLNASGVASRLRKRQATQVLEVGFGTGLNALLTAKTATDHGAALVYVALEREVLPAQTLALLNHGAMLDAHPLAAALHAWRSTLPDEVAVGTYDVPLALTVALRLLVGEATTAVLPSAAFDAVYLDALSPDVNPSLWTEPFLRALWLALRPCGCLATYSANGTVRRAMGAAGFSVERRAGPPGKREMLVGRRP
ncbi:MAG: tRNA (5-methylaminomethyl-2-thiouridine)(34)-methyltransferase MnmD [Bacteroidota bacterium]